MAAGCKYAMGKSLIFLKGCFMSTLEITTMLGCPIMCSFCPQESLRDGYDMHDKYLSLENFKKIIDKLPNHVRIDFSGMSEPWANDACTDMLEYTLQKGFSVSIFTTLYGMSEHDSDRVIQLIKNNLDKVKHLVIHLQDKNGNMKGMKLDAEWVNVMNKFIELYKSNCLHSFKFMTMDESGVVHPILSPLQSAVGNFNGHDRAGSLDLNKVKDQKVKVLNNKKGMLKCGFTDYYDQNVLLPNGDVLVCCMDYGKKHNFGNLISDDYQDLFSSKGYGELTIANMGLNNSDSSICRKCDRAVPSKPILA